MSLEGSEKWLQIFHPQPSTIPANSVKIGLVDAEIIGLTEIVKKLNIKKENSSTLQANIRLHFELQGGLIMHSICLCKKW